MKVMQNYVNSIVKESGQSIGFGARVVETPAVNLKLAARLPIAPRSPKLLDQILKALRNSLK